MPIAAALKNIYSLEGKVVLITGAAGGICSEICKAIASVGATVALADINGDGMKDIVSQMEGNGHSIHNTDLRSLDSITSTVGEVVKVHGRIDGLINGAAVSKRLGYLDVDEELYDKIMEINLKAAFFMGQQVVLQAMRHTGGKIVNLASYNSTRYSGGLSVYTCSKTGIVGLTRAMAAEWGKFNIQANAIAPGFTETPLTEPLKNDPERYDRVRTLTCSQRMAKPDELVGLTVLLLSEASSYMTGQMYNVDGGALIEGTPWGFPTNY